MATRLSNADYCGNIDILSHTFCPTMEITYTYTYVLAWTCMCMYITCFSTYCHKVARELCGMQQPKVNRATHLSQFNTSYSNWISDLFATKNPTTTTTQYSFDSILPYYKMLTISSFALPSKILTSKSDSKECRFSLSIWEIYVLYQELSGIRTSTKATVECALLW